VNEKYIKEGILNKGYLEDREIAEAIDDIIAEIGQCRNKNKEGGNIVYCKSV